MALLAGLAASGATVLSAQDWHDVNRDRADLRADRRDLRHDYDRVAALRADIARDRVRLNEDIRRGRQRQAARDAADLARDQRALEYQLRDIQRDRADMNYDRRDLGRDYRYGWR
jgi:hypothetical protein